MSLPRPLLGTQLFTSVRSSENDDNFLDSALNNRGSTVRSAVKEFSFKNSRDEQAQQNQTN